MARRILIIEDNLDLCGLLGVYLSAAGYELSYAHNCATGVAKAVSELPQLIITDLYLPDIDGVEATQILKENPATAAIPVIMLTAAAREEWKIKALEAGVAAYVIKPVSLPDLVMAIRSLTDAAPVRLQQHDRGSRGRAPMPR